MRELVADMLISLDGYALGEGAAPFFGMLGPDLQRWLDDQEATPEVLLMGRLTYELFSPENPNPPEGNDRSMTNVPKVVFSSTLREPLAWANSRLLRGELAEAVSSLKNQEGERLRTVGSLTLVKGLLRAGLVDKLRLLVFPLILGDSGREPLFAELPDIQLELLSSTVLDGSILELEYQPQASLPTDN